MLFFYSCFLLHTQNSLFFLQFFLFVSRWIYFRDKFYMSTPFTLLVFLFISAAAASFATHTHKKIKISSIFCYMFIIILDNFWSCTIFVPYCNNLFYFMHTFSQNTFDKKKCTTTTTPPTSAYMREEKFCRSSCTYVVATNQPTDRSRNATQTHDKKHIKLNKKNDDDSTVLVLLLLLLMMIAKEEE